MKLSIRLQNHGKKNHPLWWIVIAPNRKNIFGRFIEHVGYWSPRHGVLLQRQIILNIPRIKHWVSNGAVPTFKVQKFLSLWGILPAPWYYQKSEEQIAKSQKPVQQLTDKQKRKLQLKEKRRARDVLPPNLYYKEEARFKYMSAWRRKFETLKRTQQRQNQVIRELLLDSQFSKLAKIRELSGKTTYSDTEEIKQLKNELESARSQLAFMKKNVQSNNMLSRNKLMNTINKLAQKARQAEKSRNNFFTENLKHLEQAEGEYMSEELLNAKLQYELIVKKMEKNYHELQQFSNLNEPILMEEYADFLVQKKSLAPQQAYIEAQREFIERGMSGNPICKYQLVMYDQIQRAEQEEEATSIGAGLEDVNAQLLLKRAVQMGELILPIRRTVHPAPDLRTYIPQEYYEPLMNHDFRIVKEDSLTPYEQLQKYHETKKEKRIVV